MSDPVIAFTVISQAGFKCPYCDAAVDLLDEKGLPYQVRKLSRSAVLEQAAAAKMSSIPIIYHGVRLVGGHKELVAYLLDMEE